MGVTSHGCWLSRRVWYAYWNVVNIKYQKQEPLGTVWAPFKLKFSRAQDWNLFLLAISKLLLKMYHHTQTCKKDLLTYVWHLFWNDRTQKQQKTNPGKRYQPCRELQIRIRLSYFHFTGSLHYTPSSFSSWSTITHTSEKVLSGFKQLPWMQCVPRIGG